VKNSDDSENSENSERENSEKKSKHKVQSSHKRFLKIISVFFH